MFLCMARKHQPSVPDAASKSKVEVKKGDPFIQPSSHSSQSSVKPKKLKNLKRRKGDRKFLPRKKMKEGAQTSWTITETQPSLSDNEHLNNGEKIAVSDSSKNSSICKTGNIKRTRVFSDSGSDDEEQISVRRTGNINKKLFLSDSESDNEEQRKESSPNDTDTHHHSEEFNDTTPPETWQMSDFTENTDTHQVTPISDVDVGITDTWQIKGKVIMLTNLTAYESPQKKGKFIKFVLKDQSGDILLTAFSEKASEIAQKVIFNETYEIENGIIKLANEKYRQYSKHKCEITCTSKTRITKINSSEVPVEDIIIEFTDFETASNLPEYSTVNIRGKVIEVFEPDKVYSTRLDKSYEKKSVLVKGECGNTLFVDLWGSSMNDINVKDLNRNVKIINGKINYFQSVARVSTTGGYIQLFR
ncbi:unnamed protein product [Bemisia tabaci]|uniref:Uncharacterized protein n=1 Tax=Bemisia tabaci TaxID=7038 RepID=A0A9P0F3V5_BEMTA|nr:unnamed protein product [Bemisia tabaci]